MRKSTLILCFIMTELLCEVVCNDSIPSKWHPTELNIIEESNKFDGIARQPTKTALIGYKEYIQEITQEFVYEIENFGLSNFQIQDFDQQISKHYFGYEVVGNISYTYGFMDTIQSATIKNYTEQSMVDEDAAIGYIYCQMEFQFTNFYFNFKAILTNANVTGTVGILEKNVGFKLTVYKSYKNGTVWGEIEIVQESMDPKIDWEFYPFTKELEIIRQEAKHSFWKDWDTLTKTSLSDLLNQVVRKIPFPEICFDCSP